MLVRRHKLIEILFACLALRFGTPQWSPYAPIRAHPQRGQFGGMGAKSDLVNNGKNGQGGDDSNDNADEDDGDDDQVPPVIEQPPLVDQRAKVAGARAPRRRVP